MLPLPSTDTLKSAVGVPKCGAFASLRESKSEISLKLELTFAATHPLYHDESPRSTFLLLITIRSSMR